MTDILFINKYRENILKCETDSRDKHSKNRILSSGLNNSVNFINDALTSSGISTAHEHCIDSNYIYIEINKHKPKIVIIEALWAMPAKFIELGKLFPGVKFILRLHSDLSFIASEGIFSQWFFQYLNIKNFYISSNSIKMVNSLKHFVPNILYLPNYYPIDDYNDEPKIKNFDRNIINIGCFGAIRILKNQLLQAFAAIEFADKLGLTLNFHMNSTRMEDTNSNSAEKNIRNLFVKNKRHIFTGHIWMEHPTFLNVVSGMDIALQTSFAETFNIVAADSVNRNVPTIVSTEIYWADDKFKIHATDYEGLIKKMFYIWENRNEDFIYHDNKEGLKQYCQSVLPIWKSELSKLQ